MEMATRSNGLRLIATGKGSAHTTDCHMPPVASPQSHCTVCHNTFGKVSLFDSHRVDLPGGKPWEGACVHPVDLNLILENGVWDTPEGQAYRREFVERVRDTRGRKS